MMILIRLIKSLILKNETSFYCRFAADVKNFTINFADFGGGRANVSFS